jgi:hypothetical protein
MRGVRPWQFSKPKTPGFGLTSGFYLSILSSRSVMPSLAQIIEPGGAGGAVAGLGAPLAQGTGKELLDRPLQRGAYALASNDRKTVIKMLVLSKEEAGFDPEFFAQSAMALEVSPEAVVRIRATWTLAQLTFESHDPAVYPALDFVLGLAQRISDLGDGVVSDPVSRRYLLPEQVFQSPRLDAHVDAREHISVNLRMRPDGNHVYTLGMQKFGLPEFEIIGLLDSDAGSASRFLIALSQSVLLGDLAHSGDKFGAPSMSFEARAGGFDLSIWEGIEVLELLPPTTVTSTEALMAWEAASKLP